MYEVLSTAALAHEAVAQGQEDEDGRATALDHGIAEAAARQKDYEERFANPFAAAARGFVDDVIDPRETRARVISAFDMLQNKRDSNPPRKHGNIPL